MASIIELTSCHILFLVSAAALLGTYWMMSIECVWNGENSKSISLFALLSTYALGQENKILFGHGTRLQNQTYGNVSQSIVSIDAVATPGGSLEWFKFT